MMPSSDLLTVAVVLVGTGTAALVDLRTRRVPNVLTGSLAATGVALAVSGAGEVGIAAACAGGLLGLLLMSPGYLVGATGGGDVKLLAATGTLLGPAAILVAFVVTTIAGGVFALAVAALRGHLGVVTRRILVLARTGGANKAEIETSSVNNRFAYAPAIAVGAIAATVFA